jgi:hypothetical protein
MSPKAKAPAAAAPAKKAKGAEPKAEAKAAKGAEKAAAGKKDKGGKAAKASKADEEDITNVGGEGAPVVDQDEIEEAEDAAAAASSGGGNSNDAALAAASGSGEMSASFKNFRHHPDMENFYRFIYENDLRHEALSIIDKIMVDKVARRGGGKSKH